MADYPHIPLFTDAYLADTRHLTTLEHGAYLLLMMEAWRRPTCSIPDDDKLLARLSGLSAEEWDTVKTEVMAFWVLNGRLKTWSQKRLSKERAYVALKSSKNRDNVAKRWNKTKNTNTNVIPNGYQTDTPTPTPTPTPIKEEPNGSLSAKKPDPSSQAIAAFNQIAKSANWAQVQKLTSPRKKALLARIKEVGGLDNWKLVIDRASKSEFLTGKKTDWAASFDWLCKPANFTKLMEGNYDERNGFNNNQSNGSGMLGAAMRNRAERADNDRIHGDRPDNENDGMLALGDGGFGFDQSD